MGYGLDFSFVDRNKHVKKNLAASMEAVAERITPSLEDDVKEDFHEFLRASTDIFTKNVYSSEDPTYQKLKGLIKNESIAVVSGDKESSIVVMNKADYIRKMHNMIQEGIENGVYIECIDTSLIDLKHFNRFLYTHFKYC